MRVRWVAVKEGSTAGSDWGLDVPRNADVNAKQAWARTQMGTLKQGLRRLAPRHALAACPSPPAAHSHSA